MTGPRTYGYVYGGTVTFSGKTREIEGSAWAHGRCDEVRLRAAAVQDLSRTENVPLAGIEITDFWYSELVTDDGVHHPCVDPFSPRGSPEPVDPFSPHDVPDK